MYYDQDSDSSPKSHVHLGATPQSHVRPKTSGDRGGDIIGYTEAAELLGVAIGTMYAHVHHRRVPFMRLSPRCVRFSKTRLLAWLAAHAVEPNCDGEVQR